MKALEKFKWIVIGILLLSVVILSFLIQPVFGLVILVAMVSVIVMVNKMYKKPVDQILDTVARKFDLHVVRHPFTYNKIEGTLKGSVVKLDFTSDWKNDLGLTTAWMTDHGIVALIDVRNLLRIRMKAPCQSTHPVIINNGLPTIIHKEDELIYLYPFDLHSRPTSGMFTNGIKTVIKEYERMTKKEFVELIT